MNLIFIILWFYLNFCLNFTFSTNVIITPPIFIIVAWRINHISQCVPYLLDPCRWGLVYGVMGKWLRHWIPNLEVLCSKSLGRSLTLLTSIKWIPGVSGNSKVKSKLPPRSGSVALRQLNVIHKKGPWSCFF